MDVQHMLEDDVMYYMAFPHSGIILSLRRRRMLDAVRPSLKHDDDGTGTGTWGTA